MIGNIDLMKSHPLQRTVNDGGIREAISLFAVAKTPEVHQRFDGTIPRPFRLRVDIFSNLHNPNEIV